MIINEVKLLSPVINFVTAWAKLGVMRGCFITGSIIETFRKILFNWFTFERITKQSDVQP